MSSAGTNLGRAVEAFRRGQGLLYLGRVGGQRGERVAARRWLCTDPGLEAREQALRDGELAPEIDAALCAHMARAALEHHYDEARQAALDLSSEPVRIGSDQRRVDDIVLEWVRQRGVAQRMQLTRALDSNFAEHAQKLGKARASAERQAGNLLARLEAKRHPDAGPEGGSVVVAERFLKLTDELAQEAFAFARREHQVEESESGLETLFALLGASLSGLVPRPGRMRRLAGDWAALGLRQQLRNHARAALDHPGPTPATHVVVLAAPSELRVSASALEFGLASELLAAEAVGRAAGHAHASAALPVFLRHAPVASVARAFGQLGMLLFTDPHFLRRVRGLSSRESHIVARLSAAFYLAETRLLAASVLSRSQNLPPDNERMTSFAARALMGSLPHGWGALLVTRLSPGGPFRAKSLAPALAYTLRERFDEDWFLNPRAAEPLRGALARAGEFSVEAWAEEQGAHLEQGPKRLSELF